MIVETSYALTMPNLNVLLDRVVNDREIINFIRDYPATQLELVSYYLSKFL
jgi:hypothetical protein